jgi:hypothetical protein
LFHVLLSLACLQANSQAQEWSNLAEQLSDFSLHLTNKLQRDVVPNTWGAVQKGFDIMVEVYQTKLKTEETPSVSTSIDK